MDGKGNNHVLWYNTDGRMAVWSIDGNSNVISTPIFNPGSGWAAQGLAVDSAGSNRVLWDNVDGRTAVWTITGQGSGDFHAHLSAVAARRRSHEKIKPSLCLELTGADRTWGELCHAV